MEYNPDTCITAGELRAMGASILDTIPDCAWIPRHALKPLSYSVEAVTVDAATRFDVTWQCEITEPFRWITINGTIKI